MRRRPVGQQRGQVQPCGGAGRRRGPAGARRVCLCRRRCHRSGQQLRLAGPQLPAQVRRGARRRAAGHGARASDRAALRQARHGRAEGDAAPCPATVARQGAGGGRLVGHRGAREPVAVRCRRRQAGTVPHREGRLQGQRHGDLPRGYGRGHQGPAPGRQGAGTRLRLRGRRGRLRCHGAHLWRSHA